MIHTMLSDLQRCWRPLVVTDLAFKVLAFVILTPIFGLMFRTLIGLSGRSVLADEDILTFFLGPLGLLTIVVMGALGITILALEQSALMIVVYGAEKKVDVNARNAIQISLTRVVSVLHVTARMVFGTLLVAAPFLIAAGVTYKVLLGQYDINYYLAEKPSEFMIALGIGGVLVVGLSMILIYLYSGWIFALPMLFFEKVSPSQVLRASRERATGFRRITATWIAIWLVTTLVVSVASTLLAGWLGGLLLPRESSSLKYLAFCAGLLVLVLFIMNVVVAVIRDTSFSLILMNLYRKIGAGDQWNALAAELPASEGRRSLVKISKSTCVLAAVLGMVIAAVAGISVLLSLRTTDEVEITAHRGASSVAPENTMAAFQKAIDLKADWCELDVQETADGVVVVMHDSDFKKVSGNDLKIWDATLEDLEEIDIGSWYDPDFKAERVPTLAQVLALCKGKIGVTIELKYYGHDQQLEQRVVDIVEAQGMESEVVIMSLKQQGIEKIRKLRPKWTIGLLTAVAIGDITRTDADFFAVSQSLATPVFVASVHDKERRVHTWTVNDAMSMSSMIGRGVDNLITDKPELARSVLKQRQQMTTMERLLVDLTGLLGVKKSEQ